MGQTLGRAPLPSSCRKFLNLPRSAIYNLWEAFNDIAEGFGLTIEEFQEIIKAALLEYLGISEKLLNIDTDIVFRIFDDDKNNLVDSLEFLSSFAMLSGMTPEEKIRFMFAMYDFDETSVLTLDEMVLAFRSALSGLAKLSKITPPSEADIEVIVVQGFESLRAITEVSDNEIDFLGMDKEFFIAFCLNTPEIMSWIEYFDDVEEYEMELASNKAVKNILEPYLDRSIREEAVMNPTTGGVSYLSCERNGPSTEPGLKKKWQSVTPFLNPSRMTGRKNTSLPQHNISLDWAYGYNAFSSRQNLYYTAHGSIVYPVGGVCVVQNVIQNTQKHFTGHTDLVTCLKVYHAVDGKTIVASGEVGVQPFIHIWEAESLMLLSSLYGFHKKGVAQVDFSPDRSKLVTLGMDTYHSLAVYVWATRESVWVSRSTFEPVHDVRFLSDYLLASCGKDHVYFWRGSEADKRCRYKKYRGFFGLNAKPENLWCVAAIGDNVVTGSDSGALFFWEGRSLVKTVRAHTAPLVACHVVKKGEEAGFVTACSNGKVQLWNSKLDLGATFNSMALGPLDKSISAICWDTLGSKILIGFKSCEIFEMDAIDGRNANSRSVVSGHFKPRISALATHPSNSRFFCTIGTDKAVRVFDATTHSQLRVSYLDTIGQTVSYSPDGLLLVIGLGSGIDGELERKEGAYAVILEENLTLVHEARDSKQQIADCKFSPDGRLLALASMDGSIYIYNAKDYAAKLRCKGHSSGVNHIDFSHNGQYLMSNDAEGDLVFWDVEKGELLPPKSMRDTMWETNTCVYSYITQGLWGPYDDGCVCNAVCRSNASDLLACADNYGRVRVTNVPCLEVNPNFIQLTGHGADVQNCRFSCDDTLLFSTGGRDGAIFQWRVTLPQTQDYDELKSDESISSKLPIEFAFDKKTLDRPAKAENVLNDRPLAICEMEDDTTAVNEFQPWQRTIVAPSRLPVENKAEPVDSLELEFVYTFTTERTRKNVLYTIDGEIVFFCGSIAVVMMQLSREQRFYRDHSSIITSIAAHGIDSIMATGDHGEVPSVRIWNAKTMKTLAVLEGFHRRAVTHLSFSQDGTQLACVGQDDFHRISVYNWRSGVILAHTRSFPENIFSLEFTPSGDGLVQCGNAVIRFWDFSSRNLEFKDALLGSRAKRQGFMCIGWIGNNAVVGTADGSLYRFFGRQLDMIIAAHADCINAISSSNKGIATVSADRFLKIWTLALECRLIVDFKTIGALSSVLRCVCWDATHLRIAVGTSASEIYEVSSGDGQNVHRGALLEGHGGEELWGVAADPTKDEFCTVGEDGRLHVWDLITHKLVRSLVLEMPARSCAYSPDGKNIAVGYGSMQRLSNKQFDGKWIVCSSTDFEILHEARDSLKWITEIKYSPNGEILAMGSYDSRIYLYNVNNEYSLISTVAKHQNYIRSIDFSTQSDWLMSSCGGYELMFFEADSGLFIPAPSRLRDVEWSTQNTAMSWAVQGIWPPQKDGTDNICCECNLFRGKEDAVVVAGDNYGRISVFRYPCVDPFSVPKRYRVSSNSLTRLRFAAGDAVLLSLVSADKGLMQWRHNRDSTDDVVSPSFHQVGSVGEDEDDILRFFNLGEADELVSDLQNLKISLGGRPWMASIVAPSNPKPSSQKPPNVLLQKIHVFGCQVVHAHGSVWYNADGEIMIPASQYICVYNKTKNQQIFYGGHDYEEISCLSVSKDGKLACSASVMSRPRIHIWDAVTCTNICILPQLHRRGVAFMQFSSDRKLLISVGKDTDHSIALWESCSGNWHDGSLLAWAKGDTKPVLFAAFYESCPGKKILFASGGRSMPKFWSRDGRCLNSSFPVYDNKQEIATLLSGVAADELFLCGSTTGHIHVWLGRKMQRTIRAHDTGVTCLWTCEHAVVSTAKDGTVKVWSLKLDLLQTFSLSEADIPPVVPVIRSVDGILSLAGDTLTRLLLVTSSAEVYELAIKSGGISLVSEAHFTGELWGLGVHPTDPDVFASCGDDKTVRVWSLTAKRVLRKAVLDCTARCVSWSPDGSNLVVGLGGLSDGKRQRKDGAFLILDALTLKPLFEGRDSRHWLQDCKFSPDGKSFAVASMDHKIYIYNRETYRLKGACDRHSSFIKSFDFSKDSVYIQSDSGDYEHFYFEAEDGVFFASGSLLKDIEWADWSCSYGWPVLGAWPPLDLVAQHKAFEPSCVHRSKDENLLAVGDTGGCVKIYNYPCNAKNSESVTVLGHVKEVSQVRFTCDGRYLISLGKSDRSIIIWKVFPSHGHAEPRLNSLLLADSAENMTNVASSSPSLPPTLQGTKRTVTSRKGDVRK